MRYLCLILSVCILLLSTVSSFIEDKCLFVESNIECADNCLGDTSQDICADYCSPFLHCNTCVGFPPCSFKRGIEPTLIHYNNTKIDIYTTNFSSGFHSTIWQPPQLS